MQDFRNLQVWRRAQELTVSIHSATERLPSSAAGGTRGQLRRASASIAANIAEGSASNSRLQFARYLQLSIASTSELESHFDLAQRLKLIHQTKLSTLMSDTIILRRMLIALRRKVLEGETQSGATEVTPD